MADNKLHTRAQALVEEARSRGEQVPVIIKFRSGRAKQDFRARLGEFRTASLRQEYDLVPAAALSLNPEEVDNLVALEDVEMVWADEPVHTWLDASVPHIQVPQVWQQFGNRGAGVTICIVDTGIDPDHPDFAGRIGLTRDFSGKGSVVDGHGHGTHVASTAAGSGAASNGRYTGVAPEASIMVAKVLADNGGGRMSDVMAGVEWAVQNGADVLNLSLGSDGSSDGQDALSTMCNAAVDAGKIVVVAAGNAGPAPRTVGSPGAAEKVITVGASTDQDTIASFSSRGPTADGRTKPDVVAPGHNIVAARAQGTSMGSPEDAHYTSASGTSMATPHVSGVAALILAANRGLLPADVKRILMETAVDLGQDANTQGRGRVDALAAVRMAAGETPTPEPTPEPEPTPTPQPEPTPPTPPQPGPGCSVGLLLLPVIMIARVLGGR